MSKALAPAPLIRWRGRTADLLQDATLLTPHPDNPNNGDTEEIVASILTLGVYRPIYASTRCGYIVAGHHLYEALLSLGCAQVPIDWDDYSEEDEIRLMLADNDIAAKAWVDPTLKLDLLERLMKTDRGLIGTGSTFETVSTLMAERKRPFIPGTMEDDDQSAGTMATCPNCQHTFPVRIDL
jgi:hypothetical protein